MTADSSPDATRSLLSTTGKGRALIAETEGNQGSWDSLSWPVRMCSATPASFIRYLCPSTVDDCSNLLTATPGSRSPC